jgi:uncharacterized RDD family membrane protein YckC
MAWHYFRDGATQGPVELPELQRLHEAGIVEATTPVWTDGMADWAPFQSTPAAASALAVAGGTGTKHACAECGKLFPEEEMVPYENQWVCAACKPIFFQRIREGVATPGKFVYAGVGRRWVAIFIDGIMLYVVNMLIGLAIGGTAAVIPGKRNELPLALNISVLLVSVLIPALYEIIMISKYGATLGKMAMKVKVVTADGGPITIGRSIGRYFAKMLSSFILMIGYLMAIWDDEKRALHDRLCTTRVIMTERA